MKIDGTGPVRPTAPARRGNKAGKTQSSNFSDHMQPAAETPGGPGSVAPVRSVDALLAIQEVDDATSGESGSRAQQWGTDLLDQLDRLRLGIVSGAVPVSELERIAAMVRQQRVQTDDPRLSAILDEIELRARVELAKFERRD